MQLTVYHKDSAHAPEERPASELLALLAQTGTVIWADMTGPSVEDVEVLRNDFRFHPLSIEDTLNQRQRPKIEQYDGYVFAILNPMSLNASDIDVREMDVYAGQNFVVTVHLDAEPAVDQARRRVLESSHGHGITAGHILYTLADVTVDGYFPIMDDIGDLIEALGDRVLTDPRHEALEEMFLLKRSLTEIWRVTGQQRDSFSVLMHDMALPLFDDSLRPYLRDVYDHILRVSDTVNTFRDSLTNVVDMYMSAVSNRLNVQVNRLTVITVGIGLVTVVVGFYGMNFLHTWPGFDSPWGIPFALLLMGLTGVGVVIALRHMDRP